MLKVVLRTAENNIDAVTVVQNIYLADLLTKEIFKNVIVEIVAMERIVAVGHNV